MTSPATSAEQKPRESFFQWRQLGPRDLDHELIWLCTTVGAVLLAIGWLKAGLPHPQCAFHAWTGYPCVSCGCTRAAMRLLHGDVAGAFLLNPLFVILMTAAVVFDCYALAVLLTRGPRLRVDYASRQSVRAIRYSAVLVIVLNWAWLIHRGV